MSRVVNCQEENCPLKTNPKAKFCPECGQSAAKMVTVTKAKCIECNTDLEDHDRFCPECGAKVERDTVAELLKNHTRPGAVTTGRGLSAEELERIEASGRAPSKVSDPTREYRQDTAHKEISNLEVPEETNLAVEMAKSRPAIQNQEGEHRAGGLSSEAKLPVDYHEGVRLIPYQFRTAAKSSRTLVQDTRGGPKAQITGPDDAFFDDEADVDPFFTDPPETKAIPDVQVPATKTASGGLNPPPEPVKCLECGRFCDENGDCPHCLDEERLADLWATPES